MRILKIVLVTCFLLAPVSPLVIKRVVALAASNNNTPVEAATAPSNSQKKTPIDPAKYIGSDSCAECHGAEATHYALTAHSKTKFASEKVDLHGCEACHGGARDHVGFYLGIQKLNEAGKEDEATAMMNDTVKMTAAKLASFKEMSAAQASESCLKCHEGSQGRSEERFNYRRSEHSRHGVSCLDCHSSHAPKRTEFLLKGSEPGMCYTCHADQKASFAKPFHHKVPEGGMKCSDCHNQHGGFMGKSLRNSVTGDSACLKCHADKQGPFVFEHAPVKVEGCQSCHTPHGSTNPKLLTRNLVRFLCIECHSNTPELVGDGAGLGTQTPGGYDLPQQRYQNCTVCHFDIHASTKDRFFR